MKTVSLAVLATLGSIAVAAPASAYESHYSHMMRQHHVIHSHARMRSMRHARGVTGDPRTTATGGNAGGLSNRN